ncbi:HAD family hydrolase [Cryobacterium algoritolerans]|uniref:HAD family hydrolase n=1 Tax=Cryobacterium algoritolerans TaxID=1259184 RepID=A0A4R8WX26_9MICO|nr:HAD family hydrolase [Cryobacterium algoritolerans]TFC19150.1 HAD family hydrolase [Cryobacterium algoritolerans]
MAAPRSIPSVTPSVAPSVVLFDLDDTLFAHRGAVADGILRYLAALGGPFDGVDTARAVALWQELEERHYHSYLAGRLDFPGQRRERARDFAAAHGVPLTDQEAADWFGTYFEHYRASWRLHDDVLPCLATLEGEFPGIRFGLITNGEGSHQQPKLERTGLDGRLERVITSAAFGVAKPDRRIFEHACTVFGVRPGEAAYVGDRLRTDAIGAAAAGLTAIWLDRRDAAVDPADAADAARLGVLRITGLAGLPAALTSRTLLARGG